MSYDSFLFDSEWIRIYKAIAPIVNLQGFQQG